MDKLVNALLSVAKQLRAPGWESETASAFEMLAGLLAEDRPQPDSPVTRSEPPAPWSARHDGHTTRYSKPGAPDSFLAHDAGGNSLTWRNADTPIAEIVALLCYHALRPAPTEEAAEV